MMKRKQVVGSVLSAAVASVAMGWAQQARAVIRFNEVHVDASGTNSTQDFIELRSTTGGAEAFAELSVLMLEGDSGAVGGTGVVDTVLPFSGTTGTNGLYLRHSLNPLTQAPPFDPATVVLESGYAHENAAITYVLVSGFTGSHRARRRRWCPGTAPATP